MQTGITKRKEIKLNLSSDDNDCLVEHRRTKGSEDDMLINSIHSYWILPGTHVLLLL